MGTRIHVPQNGTPGGIEHDREFVQLGVLVSFHTPGGGGMAPPVSQIREQIHDGMSV